VAVEAAQLEEVEACPREMVEEAQTLVAVEAAQLEEVEGCPSAVAEEAATELRSAPTRTTRRSASR
jgi:hypothetical protein